MLHQPLLNPAIARVRSALLLALVMLAMFPAREAIAGSWLPVSADSPSATAGAPGSVEAASRLGEAWIVFDVPLSNEVVVRRWTGTAWAQVGASLTVDSTQDTSLPQIAVSTTGTPYVAWLERRASSGNFVVYVKQWNGSAWVQLGAALNTATSRPAATPDIAVDANGDPVVTWREAQNGNSIYEIFAARYTGGSWTQLGGALNISANKAQSPSVATVGATPYVAFVEDDGAGNDLLYIRSWNGTAWSTVGAAANVSTVKDASNPNLLNDGGTLYVAWTEPNGSNIRQANVRRWTGASWVSEGSSVNLRSSAHATRARLASIGGTRYIVWEEVYAVHGGRIGLASWSGTAWNHLPPFGVDDRWIAPGSYATVVSSSGTPWIAWAQKGGTSRVEVRAFDSEPQLSRGTLVPNGDRAGVSNWQKRVKVSGFCTSDTSALYATLDEDVENASSVECASSYHRYSYYYGANDDYLSSAVNAALATVEFNLSDAYPLVSAQSLQLRMRAWKTGDRAATLTLNIRRSDGTLLGSTTVNPTATVTEYSHAVTGLALNEADINGLYVQVEGSIGAGTTNTTIKIAALNVDMDYVGQACGAPPCPPLRPTNTAPRGTTSPTPTLQANQFVDVDGHAHSFSQWQVRTAAGSWASPLVDSGSTSTSLTSYTLGTPLTLDEEYFFRVRYQDSSGAWSAWSLETVFAYETDPPLPPQGRRLADRTTEAVAMQWDAAWDDHTPSGLMRYDVEASTTGGSWTPACTGVVGSGSPCYFDPGGAAAPAYFRIQAIDQAGNRSPWAYYADATSVVWELRETTASTNLTAASVRSITSMPETFASTTSPNLNNLSGWWQIQPAGSAVSGAPPAGVNPSSSGRGWFLDAAAGSGGNPGGLNDGPVTLEIRTTANKVSGSAKLMTRLFTTGSTGGNTAAPTSAADAAFGEWDLFTTSSARSSVITHTGLATPAAFSLGESLYLEAWFEVTTAPSNGGGAQTLSVTGVQEIELPEPGVRPSATTALSPSTGSVGVTAPTLQGTYVHPSGVNGHLVFEIHADSGGSPGAIVETGYSSFELTSGSSGSYVPVSIADGAVYHWRVRNEDRQGRVSTWSSYRTVQVSAGNTAPSTPIHATPANGSTLADTTPTLSATFSDPDAGDTGTLTYEVCTVGMAAGQSCAAAGGSVLASGTSASGANGAAIPWTSAVLTNGTRYWHARATDNMGSVSGWSASWVLVIGSPTITVGTGADQWLSPSPLTPGVDATATTPVTVSTNNAYGYTLEVRDGSDADGLTGASDTFVDWTGTDAAPSAWASGVSGADGYFGMTVLTVSGFTTSKLAKWGTGTTATDFTNNRYAGMKASSGVIVHTTAGYSSGTDTVTVAYRGNASATTLGGNYASVLTFTATANV